MLTHANVINILLDMKDYEKDSNRQMALKIALECVNAVQISLKRNEHEERQAHHATSQSAPFWCSCGTPLAEHTYTKNGHHFTCDDCGGIWK